MKETKSDNLKLSFMLWIIAFAAAGGFFLYKVSGDNPVAGAAGAIIWVLFYLLRYGVNG